MFNIPPNYMGNPIYKHRFCAEFGYKELDDRCFKITKKYFYFNINSLNNNIIPLDTLTYIINKKIDILINIPNEKGEKIIILYLEDVIFKKIKNLIDFDYNDKHIIGIKVRYKYNKLKILKNEKDLKIHIRKRKLKIINQKE